MAAVASEVSFPKKFKISGGLIGKVQRLLSYFPFTGVWFKVSVLTSASGDQYLTRGQFMLETTQDFNSYAFLNYLDNDETVEVDVDIKEQLISEQQNIGLVAALLLTVYVALMCVSAGGTFAGASESWTLVYNISWSLSTLLSFFSVMCSIINLLVINEHASDEELQTFVYLLSHQLWGIGRVVPILFFQLSVLFAIPGLAAYWRLVYGRLGFVIMLVLLGALICFNTFYVATTINTLHSIRFGKLGVEDNPITVHEKQISVQSIEIRGLFEAFQKSCGGPEFIGDIEAFKSYVLENALKSSPSLGKDISFELSNITILRVTERYDREIKKLM